MNKAILIGNLTRDPDHRTTNNGISVCSFSVAVQRRFPNQQGERVADFFNIVTWRGLADNCAKYINKGSKVAVSGSIQNRSYDAADGTKRYITEIIADEVEFLDPPPSRSRESQNEPSPFDPDIEFGDAVDDDELPF